jgi:hypothetical protein
MSSNTPEIGLTCRMRSWMADKKGTFSQKQILDAMKIPKGKKRKKARDRFKKLVDRGEVLRVKTNVRNIFRYNSSWRPPVKGKILPITLKAIRLLSFQGCFAISDLQRMVETPNPHYVARITKRLLNAGYLSRQGKRKCPHCPGIESLYRVTDFDRFRIEVME